MAQLAIGRPLGEPDLRDQIGPDPVRRLVGLDRLRERRGFRRARLQQLRDPGELSLVEAGTGVADVPQPGAVVQAEQQGAELLARLPRLGPSADDEFLLLEQLDLPPRRRSPPRLVGGARLLRDEAFPAFLFRAGVQRARVARDLLAEA